METSILFAQIVIGMCAIHLIRGSSEYIAKWWAKNRREQSSAQVSAKKVTRDDWYVFFSCADLYGKDPDRKKDQKRKPVEATKKSRRDTRPVTRA